MQHFKILIRLKTGKAIQDTDLQPIKIQKENVDVLKISY